MKRQLASGLTLLFLLCLNGPMTNAGERMYDGSASVRTFAPREGEVYFAVELRPKLAHPALRPSQILVLFDTSASQAGEFREKALQALGECLANLAANDRVKLLAVDLQAIPLTDGFVAPSSPEDATCSDGVAAARPVGLDRYGSGPACGDRQLRPANGRSQSDGPLHRRRHEHCPTDSQHPP